MQRLILSHPDISFRFVADGKSVYFSPGDGKQESALMSIYGISVLKQLHRVDGAEQGVALSGFVGVGEAARGNRTQQNFFINGRAMRSPLLSQALEEATRQRVMIGRFPMCVLYLTMPYEAVDVNVHPNKWEVRFQNERAVADAVQQIVRDALQEGAAEITPPPLFTPPVAPPGVPAQVLREERAIPPSMPQSSMAMRSPDREALVDVPPTVVPPEPEQVHAAETVPELARRPVRLLGAAFHTYILFESEDVLCLCDQHAMHERIMFDRLMRAWEQGGIAQTLMIPQAVRLSYREYGTFVEYQELLSQAGFDAEDFGDQTVKLHTVPMLLGAPQAESCFMEALDELVATGNLSEQKKVERIIQSACKHAVKGGERLPDEAMVALVRDVLEGNVVPTCPHGRPLMIQLTRTDLEKRFQRIPD